MQLHLINGFLGSGKTTGIIGAVRNLVHSGKTVGIVTNDKGQFQVDTAFFQSSRIPTRQVTGGCFRCSFSEFEEQIAKLQADAAPDVIFAESVGSCVDLVNTVISPIQQNSQLNVEKLTYSVFTDIRLFRRWLDGDVLPFSDQINYLFTKQIEEGSLLILNKADLCSAKQHKSILSRAKKRYPNKQILLQNSLESVNLIPWLNALNECETEKANREFDVDYPTYKAGEEQMAWMDQRFTIFSDITEKIKPAIIEMIQQLLLILLAAETPVGHIKVLLSQAETSTKISFTTADFLFESMKSDWANSIPPINSNSISLMLNARVAMQAQEFSNLVQSAVERAMINQDIEIQLEPGSAYNPEMSLKHP